MKHISNEHGVVHVLALILVLAVVSVAGLAIFNGSKARQKDTQTASVTPPVVDETATWKVFTDKNASISIKYPADWIAEPESINKYASLDAAINASAAHFRINSPGTVEPPKTAQDFKTYADQLANGLNIQTTLFSGVNVTVDQWVKSKETIKTSGNGIEPFKEITKVEDLTINGKPAKKVYAGNTVSYGPYGPEGKSVTVVYVDNGKAAMFVAGPYNSQFIDNPFNGIVQTFKFL